MTPLEELKAAAPGVEFDRMDEGGWAFNGYEIRKSVDTPYNVALWRIGNGGPGDLFYCYCTASDLVAEHPYAFKGTK